VAAFIKALIRASEYAADGHQDQLRDLQIRGGVTAEQIDTLYPKLTDYSTTIAINEDAILIFESVSKFLKENNITPEQVNIREWYDGSFYEQALKELKG
jgi:ABC-type nitrate/sulfonate/bicarbonate transport system substrate-binding protein